MPKLKINDIEVEVAPETSVLQAAEQLGIEIPRFCYHDRLSVPANCRMCLVEVKGGPPKPAASCALACAEGMEVYTDSDMVRKARKGVMEFMLVNHPLDCPICDQGGECDLQDQAVAYGYDRSRYMETKRAVKDKDLGPLVKTVMTRCIQCTRCVRFSSEIAGVTDLGLLNRGEDVEIGTFVEKTCASELSGNLVDVCPVGALTNKPAAFTMRPWELRRTDSIDVMDAVGSNISVGARGGEVMRIQPRLNEQVNEEWLGDKSRYCVDGLKNQRLDRPYVRGANGEMAATGWDEAFAALAAQMKGLQGFQMAALAGAQADCESMLALKDLMYASGANMIDCRTDGATYDASTPAMYRFNTTIAGLEQADAIVLIGTNPRAEAAIVNARIRKAWLNNRTPVFVIGAPALLNYPHTYLGNDAALIAKLPEILAGKTRPALILGSGALQRGDGEGVQNAVLATAYAMNAVRDDWNGFNVLHRDAARVGGTMLGFLPPKGQRDLSKAKLVWCLGVDDTNALAEIPADACVVYIGSHGDAGADRADIILPAAAYTEKDATFVNTEGRMQQTRQAVFPPTMAKDDWKIIRAFSAVIGRPLPYNTLAELRAKLPFAHVEIGSIAPAAIPAAPAMAPAVSGAFGVPVADYYRTCPISRASATLAEASAAFVKPASAQLAAE